MDNAELFALVQDLKNDIDAKFEKIFDLLGEGNDKQAKLETRLAVCQEKIKNLEARNDNLKGNISLAISVVLFVFFIIMQILPKFTEG